MINKIVGRFKALSQSYWYWLSGGFIGIVLLAVGQFYQHVLDHQPCVMCIQVRLWLSLLVVISVFGLLAMKSRLMNSVIQFCVVMTAAGLMERSYQLLGTERGFVFGDCGFDLGLPGWFAIGEWLPWLYRVETSCGYTPELVLGITMAEALMLFSTCLLIISLGVWLVSFVRGNTR